MAVKKKNKNNSVSQNQVNATPVNTSIKQEKWFYFIILALPLVIYFNTLFNKYALDDKAVLTENQFTLKGIDGIKDLVTHDHFYGHLNGISGLYRPVPLIIHALEFEFFGLNPFVGHLLNILLFSIACLVLFLVFKKWLKSYATLIPFFAVVLFIVHPIHTEIVANIKGRDDIINLLFLFLSVLFLMKYSEDSRILNYLVSVICFTVALFSKESAITFLLILPLSMYFFSEMKLKSIFFSLAGFIVVTSIYLVIRSKYIDASNEYRILDSYFQYAPDRADRLATGISNLLNYFKLLIFPHPLVYDYSYNTTPLLKWTAIKPICSLVLILALGIFSILQLSKKSVYSFAIIFYFATLALSSNVVTPNQAIFAERYIFLSSVAWCLVIPVAMSYIIKPDKSLVFNQLIRKNLFVFTIFILLCVVYSIKTINRNKDWKDDFTLFSHDIQFAERNARAHYNLGTDYAKVFLEKAGGKTEENYKPAIAYLQKTLAIDPQFYDAYFTLGLVYFNHGNFKEAGFSFNAAYKIDPNCMNPNYSAENALFYSGLAFINAGDFKSSIKMNMEFLKFTPVNRPKQLGNIPFAYNNIGNSYMQLMKFDSAQFYLKQAISIAPLNETAYNNMYLSFIKLSQLKEGVSYFKELIDLNPQNNIAKKYLGILYYIKKDFLRSENLLNSLLILGVKDASVFHYLGSALLQLGNNEKAIFYFKEAIKLDPSFKNYYQGIVF